MNRGFKKSVLFIFMAIAGGALAWVFFLRSGETLPLVFIQGADVPVSVTVVDSPDTRQKGLSRHPGLAENEGMFFVFNAPEILSFWMKDMLFAIDIIWISSDWRIVDITKNITPETYPDTFSPAMPVQYVLEVSAGFVDANNVKIGQSVELKK